MTKIKIVTDSSAVISPERLSEIEINVVSLSVMIDGVIYADKELDNVEFMSMMANAKSLPKTSQPPIGEFIELYDKLGEDGSEIISIHLTEKLSGTVNTARQAAQMSKSNVTVIDSDYIDQALGFQVYEAAKLAQSGASKDDVLQLVEDVKKRTSLYIGVATLENLVKGGRVGKLVGALSGFLNMKIMMQLVNGELEVVGKGRGNKTFTKWLTALEKNLAHLDLEYIGISDADSRELTTELKNSLLTILPDFDIPIIHTIPLVATHAGKGAFAIMYYTK
ncbi:DegV family protein [Vagococcus vulneris]|uniref:EDD domain protein n=1 Tax=Vagococcus vulneris TaxID=1977869 RepID=A0A429ZZ85_9ENTE|nr:DegV family protein [Vagococcus vulneris]RST99311.1 hypothetical protein CBF37_04910 [Vagococcus vulneris]